MKKHDVNEEEVMHEEILLGDFLAKARRSHKLSQAQVAKRLCLEESFIKMIEDNQFHDIKQSPVFVRGHIRSYARLLVIPESEIIALLDAHGIACTPKNVADMAEVKPVLSVQSGSFRYMTWGIIALLVILVGIWWSTQITNKPPVVETPPAVNVVEPMMEVQPVIPPPVVEETPVAPPKVVKPAVKPVMKPPVEQHQNVTNQLTMDYN